MATASKERLHEIASRKLASLGIQFARTVDEELTGEVLLSLRSAGRSTTTAGRAARFVVLEHDKMRFLDPPLDGIGAVVFYDCASTAALEARVQQRLADRAQGVAQTSAKLRALGFEVEVDNDKVVGATTVHNLRTRWEIVVEGAGARVARVHESGRLVEVPRPHGDLNLDPFRSRMDFEIHLTARMADWVAAGLAAAAAAEAAQRKTTARAMPAVAPDVSARIVALPSSTEVPTLGRIVEALGPGVVPNRLEVMQDFELGGDRYRLVAVHEAGTRFRGALYSHAMPGARPIWEDAFDLTRLHGLSELVAYVLTNQVPASATTTTTTAAAPSPAAVEFALPNDEVPAHMLPSPGETWVMHVQIEQDDGANVAYFVQDIDGRPVGALRNSSRAEFEAVFALHQGRRGMRVVIDEVADGDVRYRLLDGAGQPTSSPRHLPVAQLVATFVPESGLY